MKQKTIKEHKDVTYKIKFKKCELKENHLTIGMKVPPSLKKILKKFTVGSIDESINRYKISSVLKSKINDSSLVLFSGDILSKGYGEASFNTYGRFTTFFERINEDIAKIIALHHEIETISSKDITLVHRTKIEKPKSKPKKVESKDFEKVKVTQKELKDVYSDKVWEDAKQYVLDMPTPPPMPRNATYTYGSSDTPIPRDEVPMEEAVDREEPIEDSPNMNRTYATVARGA